MTRLTGTGDRVTLEQGGTVVSSIWSPMDEAVIVSIQNQPTSFLSLELINAKKNMLKRAKPLLNGKSVVFPNRSEYYFPLPDWVTWPAPAGTFTFKLWKDAQLLDSTTAHIGTDYLYFHCTGTPRCDGNLEVRQADGALRRSWSAISGPHGNGRINDCNYFEIPGIRRLETGQNHETDSFTDPSGNRWKTAPFVNRNQCTTSRSGFEIHPDGKGVGTEGCIGISRSIKDTREIWAELYIINLTFGPTKLIVGP